MARMRRARSSRVRQRSHCRPMRSPSSSNVNRSRLRRIGLEVVERRDGARAVAERRMAGDVVDPLGADIDDAAVAHAFELFAAGHQHDMVLIRGDDGRGWTIRHPRRHNHRGPSELSTARGGNRHADHDRTFGQRNLLPAAQRPGARRIGARQQRLLARLPRRHRRRLQGHVRRRGHPGHRDDQRRPSSRAGAADRRGQAVPRATASPA